MRVLACLISLLMFVGCAVTDRKDLLAEGGLIIKLTANQGVSISALQVYSRAGTMVVEGLLKSQGTKAMFGRVDMVVAGTEGPPHATCYAPVAHATGERAGLGYFQLVTEEIPKAGTEIELKPLPGDSQCSLGT